MRRRRIIVGLLLSLVTSLAAEAQPAKVARIGYPSPLSASADSANREAFRQGLRDLGYVEGQNAFIEARYADGRFERLRDLAAEIVRLTRRRDRRRAHPGGTSRPAGKPARSPSSWPSVVIPSAKTSWRDWRGQVGNITGLSVAVGGIGGEEGGISQGDRPPHFSSRVPCGCGDAQASGYRYGGRGPDVGSAGQYGVGAPAPARWSTPSRP